MGKRIIATYPYHDARGVLVFEKLRFKPKGFIYRLPDKRPATELPRRLLYRLPKLLAAPQDKMLFVCEGEKDVERLRVEGLIATCTPDGGGPGKWHSSTYNRYFRGRHVAIITDNDYAGDTYAREIEAGLRRVAKSVRRLIPPGVGHKGDLSDFLDDGGTMQDLLDHVANAKQKGPRLELRQSGHRTAVKRAIQATVSATEKIEPVALGCLTDPTQSNVALAANLSLPRVKAVLKKLRMKGNIEPQKQGRTVTYRLRG